MILKTDLKNEDEKSSFREALKVSVYSSTASFLRHMVRVYLLKQSSEKKKSKAAVKPSTEGDLKLVEFTVSIPKFVRSKVDELSESYSLKPTAFLRNLITANLTQKPILVPELANELRASNRELNAIGININQLTKILNRSVDLKLRDRVTHQHLVEIKAAIDKQKKCITDVVASSNGIWSIDNSVD